MKKNSLVSGLLVGARYCRSLGGDDGRRKLLDATFRSAPGSSMFLTFLAGLRSELSDFARMNK